MPLGDHFIPESMDWAGTPRSELITRNPEITLRNSLALLRDTGDSEERGN